MAEGNAMELGGHSAFFTEGDIAAGMALDSRVLSPGELRREALRRIHAMQADTPPAGPPASHTAKGSPAVALAVQDLEVPTLPVQVAEVAAAPIIPLGASLHPAVGEHVIAMGSPLAQAGIFLCPEVTPTRGHELYVGPILAEFGHELFVAAMARKAARHYGYVTVCTLAGREALYEDFADEIIGHDIALECACVGPRDWRDLPRERIAGYRRNEGDVFVLKQYEPCMVGTAHFHPYGEVKEEYQGAVVFHARSRQHVLARNWPVQNWISVVEAVGGVLPDARLLCIGTKQDAIAVPGTTDMRGVGLREQMNILRSARLAVGPSSGPMHLASLCKCPHVVWCGGGRFERTTIAGRYRGYWNPYRTPVLAVPYASWRPPALTVITWITDFLKQLEGG